MEKLEINYTDWLSLFSFSTISNSMIIIILLLNRFNAFGNTLLSQVSAYANFLKNDFTF